MEDDLGLKGGDAAHIRRQSQVERAARRDIVPDLRSDDRYRCGLVYRRLERSRRLQLEPARWDFASRSA